MQNLRATVAVTNERQTVRTNVVGVDEIQTITLADGHDDGGRHGRDPDGRARSDRLRRGAGRAHEVQSRRRSRRTHVLVGSFDKHVQSLEFTLRFDFEECGNVNFCQYGVDAGMSSLGTALYTDSGLSPVFDVTFSADKSATCATRRRRRRRTASYSRRRSDSDGKGTASTTVEGNQPDGKFMLECECEARTNPASSSCGATVGLEPRARVRYQ